MLLFTVPARSARYIERDRTEVTLFKVMDLFAHLDDLAGVLMSHLHPFWCSKSAIIDVKIATADVCCHELEDDTMLDFSPLGVFQLGIGFFLDLHLMRPHECHCAIARHKKISFGLGLKDAFIRRMNRTRRQLLPCDRL